MEIKGTTALVTGANRGIGRAFTQALLSHGAGKVYAGVRDPVRLKDPEVVPLRLDVSDPAQVAEAARLADDVDIVINNAGVGGYGAKLLEGNLARRARRWTSTSSATGPFHARSRRCWPETAVERW